MKHLQDNLTSNWLQNTMKYSSNDNVLNLAKEIAKNAFQNDVKTKEELLESTIQFLERKINEKYDIGEVEIISIIGPPCSGKTTLSMHLSEVLSYTIIKSQTELFNEISKENFCKSQRGLILDSFPESFESLSELHLSKIFPSFVIQLTSADTILALRNMSRLIDPQTGKIYQNEVIVPEDEEINLRLEKIEKHECIEKLIGQYNGKSASLISNFPAEKLLKLSTDQPIDFSVSSALSFIEKFKGLSSLQIDTPRIILCGPRKSGKSKVMQILAEAFELIPINPRCTEECFTERLENFKLKSQAINNGYVLKESSKWFYGEQSTKLVSEMFGKPNLILTLELEPSICKKKLDNAMKQKNESDSYSIRKRSIVVGEKIGQMEDDDLTSLVLQSVLC